MKTRPGVGNNHQSLARWLLAASVVLIIYGSSYPFDFSRAAFGASGALQLQRPSRGDLVANLLLYLPLGVTMIGAFAWRSRWRGLAGTLTAGLLLSLSIELLQTGLAGRVSSFTDLILNIISTGVGASIALAWRMRGGRLHASQLKLHSDSLVPVGLTALWLASRWAPFVPTIDLQKYKDAVKPLLRWEDFSWLSTMRYALGWLVVAQLLRLMWRDPRWVIGLVAMVAATLAAQVVVVGRVLRAPEFAALAIVLIALPLLSLMRERRIAATLTVLALIVVVAQGLAPFAVSEHPAAFLWQPFAGALSNSLEQNLLAILEKVFLYATLLWLLGSAGLAQTGALLLVVPLLLLIEIAQLWLPGRVAEITDPLLALGIGWLMGRLQWPQPSRPEPIAATRSPRASRRC